MSSLHQNCINASISSRALTAAKRIVDFNYEIHKNCFFQDYYLRGVIEVHSIKKSTCSVLLYNDDVRGYRPETLDLSFLPPLLVTKMKKQSKLACHVLLRKRIAIGSHPVVTTLIVPMGAEDVGYFCNHVVISEDGKKFLEGYFKRSYKCWPTTVPPRYSMMKQLQKACEKKLFAAVSKRFSGVKRLLNYRMSA